MGTWKFLKITILYFEISLSCGYWLEFYKFSLKLESLAIS